MIEELDSPKRCSWVGTDPRMVAYHDEEWGVPCHNDRQLFERLMLEGFQAGLSWATVLRKRANFYSAFDGWDPVRISAYGPHDVAQLLADPGIIRNRMKIEGAIRNAAAYLRIMEEQGSFGSYIWSFADRLTLPRSRPQTVDEIPTATPDSDAMSKDLKRRGFTFVGSTVCYAFMQSIGMVDDHVEGCFRAVRQ